MNNTYNNYSGTGTKTVYGPANMSNMPMKMANQTNYLSKSGAQGYGATSLVRTQSCAMVNLLPCYTLCIRQVLTALILHHITSSHNCIRATAQDV